MLQGVACARPEPADVLPDLKIARALDAIVYTGFGIPAQVYTPSTEPDFRERNLRLRSRGDIETEPLHPVRRERASD